MFKLSLTRRQLLWGLLGLGITGTGAICLRNAYTNTFSQFAQQKDKKALFPSISRQNITDETYINQMKLLRDFDYGIIKNENGKIIKEFHITAINSTIKLNSALTFNTWTYNNRVPGPTIRVKQGDRVRVIFYNQAGHAHSMHFHGLHKSEMDGVKPVRQGTANIYEFDAEPYGVHLYHCHISPVSRHIGKGLYGMFIIDPPNPRPVADEMILILGGYDVNDDGKNEFYALNGMPNFYMENPIKIHQNQLIRLYVLNMIENDPAATFHIHANMFKVYRTGSLNYSEETDVITM
ncbi:MAG TPA: multicopper oxidase domain-containing protein, partial [Allocoleopsis sp.]